MSIIFYNNVLFTNQTLRLLIKCYQNEWKELRGSPRILGNIDWIDIWKQGIAPTEQPHPSLRQCFSVKSLLRPLPLPAGEKKNEESFEGFELQRRPSDAYLFVGTEETCIKYDQQWYIKFSAVLFTSSIFILPIPVLTASYFRHFGGFVSSGLVWFTSMNHWYVKPRTKSLKGRLMYRKSLSC